MKKTLALLLISVQSIFLFASTYKAPNIFIDYNTLNYSYDFTNSNNSSSTIDLGIKVPFYQQTKDKKTSYSYIGINHQSYNNNNTNIDYDLGIEIGTNIINIDSPYSKNYFTGLIYGISVPLINFNIDYNNNLSYSYIWDEPTISLKLGRIIKAKMNNLRGKENDIAYAFIINNDFSYANSSFIYSTDLTLSLGIYL
ncbi:MAG: hypothetical protein ACPKM0_10465 [Pleomorphochaeta sp.]